MTLGLYRGMYMRKVWLCLALAGALAFGSAAADDRADTLKALVRAKAAIETGVTASEFAAIVRQIDEQVQVARATKSHDLSLVKLDATAATSEHLKRVVALWSYLIGAQHCRNRIGGDYNVFDPECKRALVGRLADVGLKLGDFSSVSPDSPLVTTDSIMALALEKAHQRVTSAIELLAAR